MNSEIWTFPDLFNLYLRNLKNFTHPDSLELEIYKYQLQIIESVLNAFTDGYYTVKTKQGRDEIYSLFTFAFGFYDRECTDEQLEKLKELFPQKPELFDNFKVMRPTVIEFYDIIFKLLKCGNDYSHIAKFYKVKFPPEANIVYTFKNKYLNKPTDDNNEILVKAIMVLLGDEICGRTFTKAELIDKFNYPIF